MLTEKKHNPLIKEVGRQTYELLKFQHFRVLWVENTGTQGKQVGKILGNPHLLNFLIILDAISLDKRNNFYMYIYELRKKKTREEKEEKTYKCSDFPFRYPLHCVIINLASCCSAEGSAAIVLGRFVLELCLH